jgi:hypothetical protein
MAGLVRGRTTSRGIPRAGTGANGVKAMTERIPHRRRASDRADERANRAAMLGDIVALWVATGQAEGARRRRAEWLERRGPRRESTEDVTADA